MGQRFVVAAHRLEEIPKDSPPEQRKLSLSPGTFVNSREMSFLATMELGLMYPKAKWTVHVRRFLNRNWKFLVQTGVTILGIMHR